jgi:FtsZ-binding cell division protein ZapB
MREPEVIQTYLQELIDHCVAANELVINAIESWTDILPEANVHTLIGELTRLHLEVERLEEGNGDLNREFSSDRERSDGERQPLRREREELERQLEEAREELHQGQLEVNASVLGCLSVYVSKAVATRARAMEELQPAETAIDGQ